MMKKILLLAIGMIALQQVFSQALNDSALVLAASDNLEYIASNSDETELSDEALAEAFTFEPDEGAVEIACRPNPIKDAGYIRLSSKNPNEISMQFLNTSGIPVKVITFITREGIRVFRGDLEVGVYFYTIFRGKENIGYGKLVIQ
ncbi:MAG: T9SS type A sorting domain-containing protein [Bacteroidota bacterium]|nr:T9SS type A sorting domain-containing protein [Bacteroidota bacterium]